MPGQKNDLAGDGTEVKDLVVDVKLVLRNSDLFPNFERFYIIGFHNFEALLHSSSVNLQSKQYKNNSGEAGWDN